MQALDFFCGAGGLTRGLLDAGIQAVNSGLQMAVARWAITVWPTCSAGVAASRSRCAPGTLRGYGSALWTQGEWVS